MIFDFFEALALPPGSLLHVRQWPREGDSPVVCLHLASPEIVPAQWSDAAEIAYSRIGCEIVQVFSGRERLYLQRDATGWRSLREVLS